MASIPGGLARAVPALLNLIILTISVRHPFDLAHLRVRCVSVCNVRRVRSVCDASGRSGRKPADMRERVWSARAACVTP